MDGTTEKKRNPLNGEEERPSCFGDPGAVCPRDDMGFIQPQAGCIACGWVKDCLKHALRAEGVLRTPITETAVGTRVSNFLKRWSDQKLAHTNNGGSNASK